jgi:hypothetical protein
MIRKALVFQEESESFNCFNLSHLFICYSLRFDWAIRNLCLFLLFLYLPNHYFFPFFHLFFVFHLICFVWWLIFLNLRSWFFLFYPEPCFFVTVYFYHIHFPISVKDIFNCLWKIAIKRNISLNIKQIVIKK